MIENVGTIATMNDEGDSRYTWDRENARECEAAHEHFDAMRKKGFLIFKIKWLGLRRGKEVRRFNPCDETYAYIEPPPSPRDANPYRTVEVATKFDEESDYVATPAAAGG